MPTAIESRRSWMSLGKECDSLVCDTSFRTTWDYAISACENLSEGGFTDWRLPNIDELMSLKSCPENSCSLSEENNCLAENCSSYSGGYNCWDSCYGPKTDNCKFNSSNSLPFPSIINQKCYWSSSTLSDNTTYAWTANCYKPELSKKPKLQDECIVRCVR